jgi:hypothetical protein
MSAGEVRETARKRAVEFRAVPGLLQKYYPQLQEPGIFAGVYIWESAESLQAYRESELAASIPMAYRVQAPPEIDVGQVAFVLRD